MPLTWTATTSAGDGQTARIVGGQAEPVADVGHRDREATVEVDGVEIVDADEIEDSAEDADEGSITVDEEPVTADVDGEKATAERR